MRRLATARLALGLALCAASGARGANGAGSLYVAGAAHTPTHWDVPASGPITAEIRGVAASEVGDSLPATITVYMKSSQFGNATVTGTRIGTTSDYAFTFVPPHGACSTSIVAYGNPGRHANNDLLDDGLQNGSSGAAGGFRFVNAAGLPLDCGSVPVEPKAWRDVKRLFR